MLDRSDIIYKYDGTFEGLLSCVYESFYAKEIPASIIAGEGEQVSFAQVKNIKTNNHHAQRVAASIKEKISLQGAELVSLCFLTCLPEKEMEILFFLRKGYKVGGKILEMITDDTVYKIQKAVKHMNSESHKLKGFIRFSVYDGMMFSVIKPKNFVLPLLREHFCGRFREEAFMIYDEDNGCALVYRPYESAIIPINQLILNNPDQEELKYQQLWKEYYDTIAIEGRYNPRCRMTHMPKRYWDYMTEFGNKAEKRLQGENLLE